VVVVVVSSVSVEVPRPSSLVWVPIVSRVAVSAAPWLLSLQLEMPIAIASEMVILQGRCIVASLVVVSGGRCPAALWPSQEPVLGARKANIRAEATT
jgi:hypothetical protein